MSSAAAALLLHPRRFVELFLFPPTSPLGLVELAQLVLLIALTLLISSARRKGEDPEAEEEEEDEQDQQHNQSGKTDAPPPSSADVPCRISSRASAMLLFTPSVGFVDLRRKVMSEPSLAPFPDADAATLSFPALISPASSASALAVGRSLSELQQIPAELWHTRRRIEAGLREQRLQKAMLERVQDQLSRSRLRHAQQWRTRSHSPPSTSSAASATDELEFATITQRPRTSCRIHFPEVPPLSGSGQQDILLSVRLAQLEAQMDKLRAVTGQNLSLTRLQDAASMRTRNASEIRAEVARLRRQIAQLRVDTRTDLGDIGRDLEQQLRLMARRLRREWTLMVAARRMPQQQPRVHADELDALRRRCAQLETQKAELLADAERRVERVEVRRDALERTHAQTWTILSTLMPSARPRSRDGADLAEAERLPSAVRSAIDAERTRWEQTLETERTRMTMEVQERREQWAAEKRDAAMELQQREQQWQAERAQQRRELDKWREEARAARLQAENAAADCARERARVQEVERESRTRVKRVEDDMAMLVETQRSARARAETEAEADRAQCKLMVEQREQMETDAERLETQLRDARAAEEDARRENATLAEALAETQRNLAKAEEQRRREQRAFETEIRLRDEQLAAALIQLERAERVGADHAAEAEAELDAAKTQLAHAEQRLQAEREERRAEAERTDRDWQEQLGIVAQLEAQREALQRQLADAEQRVQETDDGAQQRLLRQAEELRRLQRDLTRAETERGQAEEAERKVRAELERTRQELTRKDAELQEGGEREAELGERIADLELRLGKAAELCRRLNAELDDLSERSGVQNDSAERTRTELADANAELVILRGALETQRTRNTQLETELRSAERESTRERELRLKAEERARRAETEAHSAEEARLAQQREFRAERERWAAEERRRGTHQGESATDQQQLLIRQIEKWSRKVKIEGGGKQSADQQLDTLLSTLWAQSGRAEKRLAEAEQEKSALSAQLSSSRQMLLVQQAELEHHEQDHRALRAKLGKAEASAREREERARTEKTTLTQEWHRREEGWTREQDRLEARIVSLETERARLEMEHKSALTIIDALRAEQQQQNHLRQQQQHQQETRLKETVPDALRIARAELARERADAERMRAELREVQRKLAQSLQKAERLQTKLDHAVAERADEHRQWEASRKRDAEAACAEVTMRVELEQARALLRKTTQEAESAKRALREADAMRKELEAQVQREKRERAAHKQHAEALEMDRRRVDAVMRQTTMERNALHKSLGTMDAQHADLQREFTRLQTQVQRVVQTQAPDAQLRKRVQQLEAELAKAEAERRRLDKLLGQREHGHGLEMALLGQKLEQCRTQLEAERQRKRAIGGTTAATSSSAEPWR